MDGVKAVHIFEVILMKDKLSMIGVMFCIGCILVFVAFMLAIAITKETEDMVNQQDSDLIDLYYQQEKIDYAKDKSIETPVYSVEGEDGKTVNYTGKNIDCVLHLDSIGVSVPVMKGNADRDLELYRTVVANDKMKLFSTVYGIMGHHARDMSVSLGGIDKLKVGDKLRLEKGQQIVEYKVTQSVAKYADNCDYLFKPVYGTTVYLFTCDYSLAGSQVAYRVVKCEPVEKMEVEKDGKDPVSSVRSTESG